MVMHRSNSSQENGLKKIILATRFEKKNVNLMKIVSVLASLSTFCMCIYIAISSDWIDNDRYDETRGLWLLCLPSDCYDLDHSYVQIFYSFRTEAPDWIKNGDIPGWLTFCRFGVIVSCVLSFFGFLLSCLTLLNRYVYGYISSFFLLATFVFLGITIYLFQSNTDWYDERVSCGKGYTVGWCTTFLAFIATFMGFCSF